jgi:hypothetical protein
MNQGDANDYSDLVYHWGSHYRVSASDSGWTAARRDDGARVHCRTASELREEIRQDYQVRPVTRH